MTKIITVFIFAALASVFLAAHPHVSLDARLEFEFDGTECRGFWVEWTFDPFFSATVIGDFDADRNGRFEESEVRRVHDGAFINLRKYGFFTLIRRGSGRMSPESVESFKAEIRDTRLVYRFFVSLAGKGYGRDFAVAVFDTTYYCAVRYAADPVSFVQRSQEAAVPSYAREVNRAFPVYYNPAGGAADGSTYSAWKPGLQTAYPEEIHVRLPS